MPCAQAAAGMHAKTSSAATSSGTANMTAQNTNIEQAVKLTSMEWLNQRFDSHATSGVFLPSPDDFINDNEEINFAATLIIQPELRQKLTSCSNSAAAELHQSPKLFGNDLNALQQDGMKHDRPRVATNVVGKQSSRRRKASALSDDPVPHAQPRKRKHHGHALNDAEFSSAAQQKLLFAPVATAAAEVGLPKSVVQRWIADEQVAFIRPQPNNSHRLVDMTDLRQLLQQKRQLQTGLRGIDKVASSKRVLVYARVTPTEAAEPLMQNAQPHAAPSNSGLNEHILEQVKRIAHAMQLEPGKYMYNGDIATVWDWDNRPVFDLLIDKILSRDIHTIVVATPDHLVRGSAFMLLRRLCHRNGIQIKCAITDAPADSDATNDEMNI